MSNAGPDYTWHRPKPETKWQQFKQDLEYWLDDTDCSISIDLTRWSLRFDYGIDRNDDSTQIFWLFVSLGPFHLKFGPAHWAMWR